MDITSIQRDLANTQKAYKSLLDKIKNEKDPVKKAGLKKDLADLELKKSKLNSQMEDEVSKLHASAELEYESKIPYQKRILVKEFIKRLLKR